MHLNKLLEQIKRHQSPTEAIDKLATALEKHEGSLLEKGFTILKSELAANMYEAINGPHFDEEHARYAVEGMENEDGTKGPHWTVEETTSVANQIRKEAIMYPFVFNPFGRNNTVNILDLVIPKVKTIAIGESTENVVLGICPKVWCRLPKEGVIVLEVRHTAEASGASLPVFISVSGSVSTASNTHNIPLVNASSAPITGSQVSAGNRYIAYFNKCDNVIQLMNYTPAPAA